MKDWYQSSELSGLPGMPSSITGVIKKAKRDHWLAKYRQGQGGGKEYHLSSLPSETQAALHFKHSVPAVKKDQELVVKEQVDQKFTSLKGWQREIFDARLTLYREFEQLQKMHGTNKAIDAMVEMAKRAELPEHLQQCVATANARKGEARAISRSLILGWQRAVRRYGIMALAPAAVEKLTIPEWVPHFMSCYQLPSNPTIPEAMERMIKMLPEGMKKPSYNQVLRWHNKRSVLEQEKGRKTGSAYRALKGYRHRDTSMCRPLDIGVCDGHSFKAKVAHPGHGRPFNPEVCAVIDAATRMVVGFSAGLSESAHTVASAVRNAATVYEQKPYGGIFSILYTDGGSGNIAKVNTDELTGLFARIGTTHKTGIPGNAQGRGLIERLNQTLWISSARDLESYTGKSMDQLSKRNYYLEMQRDVRQGEQVKGLLSWVQFFDFLRDAVDTYNRRPHSSLPKLNDPETGRKRHMSPMECWCWHMASGWDMQLNQLPEETIEMIFLPREARTVRRASVEIFGNYYYNKELERYHGETVHVAYDVHDPKVVQIWDMEERLVCHAWFEKNKTAYFAVSAADKAAEDRANRRMKLIDMKREEIAEERRGTIDAHVESRKELAKPMAAIVSLPRPQEARTEVREARERLAVEMATVSEAFEIPVNDRDMYRLWRELDRKRSEGETLEGRASKFYESFQRSATYRSFVAVEADLSIKQQ